MNIDMKNEYPLIVKIFLLPVSSEKNKDFGLVITAVLSLMYLHFHNIIFIYCSLTAAIITLLFPIVIKPVSFIWYGLAEILGMVMSRIILTAVFFLVITPIGFIKRVVSNDHLLTERWKKDTKSLFTVRDKKFMTADIEKPY